MEREDTDIVVRYETIPAHRGETVQGYFFAFDAEVSCPCGGLLNTGHRAYLRAKARRHIEEALRGWLH